MVSLQSIKVIALTYGALVALDSIWLSLMAPFYKAELGSYLRNSDSPYWALALLVWLLLIIGLYTFVLPKANSLLTAFIYGSLYGFIVYGVYDLTNYATLGFWSFSVVLVDTAWGMFANGLVAMLMFLL